MRLFLPIYLTVVVIILCILASFVFSAATTHRRIAARAVSVALPDDADGPALDCD